MSDINVINITAIRVDDQVTITTTNDKGFVSSIVVDNESFLYGDLLELADSAKPGA